MEVELGETKHGVDREREKCQELAIQLREKETLLSETREQLARTEVTLDRESERHVADIEAIKRDATLDRYRAIYRRGSNEVGG